MKIWTYNPETKELIGEGKADPDPLTEGEFLQPFASTTNAPPEARQGYASVWNGTSWTSLPDHRGETWWPNDQQHNDVPGRVIDFIGDPAAHQLTNVEPPAPPAPPPPPVVVSPWQIRAALSQLGLRAGVESYVTGSADQAIHDAWNYATEFRRDNAMIAAAATALGKTSADIDGLFQLALTLKL